MSGILGLAITAENSFSAISSLLPNAPVILGNFGFQNFEIPESISFGTKSTITTHRLNGGLRVFDLMGAEASDIEWHGRLLSADAQQRQAQLTAMHLQGGILPLWFGSYNFNVIIDDLQFVLHQQNNITYSIKLVVVNYVPPTITTSEILADVVNFATTAAQAVNIISTIFDSYAYTSTSNTATAQLAAVVAASGAALVTGSAAAKAAASAAQAALATMQSVEGIASTNLATLATPPAVGSGATAANYVSQISAMAQQCSQINQVKNYVGTTANDLS